MPATLGMLQLWNFVNIYRTVHLVTLSKTLTYLKSNVFLDVTHCRLVNTADVSEEHNAY